jgi:hypothetical protein
MVTVSLETSKSLVANGIVIESYFNWLKATDKNTENFGKFQTSPEDQDGYWWSVVCPAPTAGEILKYLMACRAKVSVSLGRGEYYVDVFTDEFYFKPYRFINDNLEEPLAEALLKLKELKLI